jgi:hypothetical protein
MRAMAQYKVWYRKACGDSLLIKKADRFWDKQLKKRHWRHFLVGAGPAKGPPLPLLVFLLLFLLLIPVTAAY